MESIGREDEREVWKVGKIFIRSLARSVAQGHENIDPIATADEKARRQESHSLHRVVQGLCTGLPVHRSVFQEVDPWVYQNYRKCYDHYWEKWQFMKLHKTSAGC